jgi:DNA-binding transcriptional ArsR family regulator
MINQMVEQVPNTPAPDFDAIFHALAHPIRRAALEQLAEGPKSVGELAAPHEVSLAAVSKHLRVLEEAGLIDVEADGRVRRCHLDAAPLSEAFGWLTRYRVFWEDRFDALADHLENEPQ